MPKRGKNRIDKHPDAPTHVARHRNRLSSVSVHEISSVDQGANQFADVILAKRLDAGLMRAPFESALIELSKLWGGSGDAVTFDQVEAALRKTDEEPRTFDEIVEGRLIQQVDEALDARSHAFMSTTWGILMSDSDDKEQLLLAAVSDFADLMGNDIPELLAGRLAKDYAGEMLAILSGSDAPTFSDVCKRGAMLLSLEGDGGVKEMKKLFEKVSDEERVALDELKKKAEANEKQAAVVVKAAEDLVKADAEIVRLKKLAAGIDDDDDVHPLLKGKSEEEAAALAPVLKHFEGEMSKLRTQNDGLSLLLKKQTERARAEKMEALAKSFDSLGVPVEDLVEQLTKADERDELESLMTTLTAANKAAKAGLEAIGSDASGEGKEGDYVAPRVGLGKGIELEERSAADQVVTKLAKQLQTDATAAGSPITEEAAYVKAAEALPEEVAIAAGNAS